MISRRKNIRTVLNKTPKLEGDKRVAHYEILAENFTLLAMLQNDLPTPHLAKKIGSLLCGNL
ncbi:hypothetical protein CUJ83_03970 [Methanocella sp. CWC-04]|uniref:Uncharacterized protein n=1 Tax=Methanooceanicella nereidis TaxID=2052831 RepID=A0AAP2W4E1_9EURY|nr:hypothetical protein [Methanocella sp. CWC-04]MCD1294150.1 hypothetical protein [Methanocella sp. CWC-04]